MRTRNSVGTQSSWSPSGQATPQADVPDRVAFVGLVNAANGIQSSWGAPEANGSPIIGYDVQIDDNSGFSSPTEFSPQRHLAAVHRAGGSHHLLRPSPGHERARRWTLVAGCQPHPRRWGGCAGCAEQCAQRIAPDLKLDLLDVGRAAVEQGQDHVLRSPMARGRKFLVGEPRQRHRGERLCPDRLDPWNHLRGPGPGPINSGRAWDLGRRPGMSRIAGDRRRPIVRAGAGRTDRRDIRSIRHPLYARGFVRRGGGPRS